VNRALVAGVLLCGAAPARADQTNRNLFPIGEAEALRANAGIAGSSPGSVFHNPAGLAKITHPQLAVSGTTLMYFRSSTARLIQLDEAVPYEASGFAPIPASLVSTYKAGGFSLATAILVPDLFQLDNRQRHDTAAASVEILQSIRRQDLWLGGSIARDIGHGVSVGLSAFGVRRTLIQNSYFQLTVPSMPDVISQNTSSETDSIIGLTAVLGAQYDAAPWLTIGARIEPPFLQLSGTASIYQSQLSSDGTTVTHSELDKDDVSVDQPVPADFGFGVAVRPSDKVTVFLDVAVQLPKTYTAIDDPDLGTPEETELRTAPRGSLGIDIVATEKLTLHGGALFNRAAQRRLTEDGDAREDYWGGTLGLTWVSERTRTGLGAIVLRSSSKIVPILAAGETESATTTVVAGLLTVAYML
jgi:long-subunit fatty acid transport protein